MSSETPSERASAFDGAIGTLLRQKREAIGWTIEEVAEYLRIRSSILQGLEDENYETLPGRVYLLGFLKNYASFLGLDGQKILDEFSKKNIVEPVSSRVKISDVSFLQGQKSRSTPIGFFVGIGVVLTIAVYGGWYYVKGHNLPPHQAPLLMEHGASLSDGDHNNPLSFQQNMQASKPADNVEKGNEVKNNPQLPVALPNVAPSLEVASSPFIKNDSNIGQSVSSQEKSQIKDSDQEKKLVLYAQDDSWISIKDSKNKIVFSGILKKGSTWQGDATQEPYFLTTGNAGGVYFKMGNMQTPPLGNKGIVRHDLKVTEEQVMSGVFGALSEGLALEHHDEMH